MCVKFSHAKFQCSSARGTFSKLGLKMGARKICFSMENWPYLGNGERRDKVAIGHRFV